ncbi:MAG TPA: radical SAM protein [Spirochaetota bacterium]|nr:radical SAM protein [Spirochaetota bacterium]
MINKTKNEFIFDNVFIEEKFKENKNIEIILSKIKSNYKLHYINDNKKILKTIPKSHPGDISKNLLLSGIRGEILRKCPGTNGHICCNYYVINLYVGCPIECSYCILQSYLNEPLTIINIDIDNIFEKLHNTFVENSHKLYRVGTGELGDSLVYDYLTDYSLKFIEFFSDYKNAIFEFKTKTNNINNLLKIKSPGNIVVGFSMNPQSIIDSEELFAASLEERLNAMKSLVEKNYKIAIHFDPIINIPNFKDEYSILIDKIFQFIKPENIAWISLGTFRYTPDLKSCIEYNYPKTKILLDQFIIDQDKKFRYFKPIRINLYQTVIRSLKKINEDLPIYLCMESVEVWKKTLGYLPNEKSKINLIFKNMVNL